MHILGESSTVSLAASPETCLQEGSPTGLADSPLPTEFASTALAGGSPPMDRSPWPLSPNEPTAPPGSNLAKGLVECAIRGMWAHRESAISVGQYVTKVFTFGLPHGTPQQTNLGHARATAG